MTKKVWTGPVVLGSVRTQITSSPNSMRRIAIFCSGAACVVPRLVGALSPFIANRPKLVSCALRSVGRLGAASCLLLLPFLAGAQNAFSPGGNEYPIVGNLLGEQTWPQAAVNTNGGVLVWQDNNADGNGLGIRASRLNPGLMAVGGIFRVNSIAAGDQEKPRVALLQNGGAVIVWQGGTVGFQKIFARFLNPTGTNFVANDVMVNTYTNSFQIDPAVATLADGSVIVVWASDGQDGSYQGIFGQRFTAAGGKLGPEFRVNDFTANNQRSPAVAALKDGGFVVVWISELERNLTSVDAFGRLFNSAGNAVSGEFLVNTGNAICAHPDIAASPDGGFAVAWSELNVPRQQITGTFSGSAYPGSSWDVMAEIFNVSSAGGSGQTASVVASPFRLNTMVYGNQYSPKLSAFGPSYLATWVSMGQDAAWEGVYGQFFSNSGKLAGVEFRVNTTTAGRQLQPAVCSDGISRFLVTWTSFVAGTSFDLMGRAYDLIQVSINQAAGGLKISWNTQPGSVYQIQVSTDYVNWSDYGAPRTAAGYGDAVTINNLATAGIFRVVRVE